MLTSFENHSERASMGNSPMQYIQSLTSRSHSPLRVAGHLLFYLICTLAPSAWANHRAPSRDLRYDLTELSLEELLDLRVEANTINILESHIHKKGERMMGYRTMTMVMEGNRDGASRRSVDSVLADFPVAPTEMRMETHMSSLMYAFSDDLTLMAMAPFKLLTMDNMTRKGASFTTRSQGLADVKVMANQILYRLPNNRRLASLLAGLSLPTGSIDERDDTPIGPNQKLPYPMQLGSGTYDLLTGVTFLGIAEHWSWGLRGLGTIRLGENDNDYRLGNRLDFSAWGTRLWANWLSTSVRLDGQSWANIDGADPDLNPAMVPTADPDRRGGTRLDLLFGIELLAPTGRLKGNRLGIEVGAPIYQNLNGPQLETDWRISVGWQWIF